LGRWPYFFFSATSFLNHVNFLRRGFRFTGQLIFTYRMSKYLLGLDVGSSSVKAALVDVDSGKTVSVAQSPQDEMPMSAPKPGWAEQDPDMWWSNAKESFRLAASKASVNTKDIVAIGISYQMHGLVCVDKTLKPFGHLLFGAIAVRASMAKLLLKN
jgi:sugar (pentulose or hexulose) kinase